MASNSRKRVRVPAGTGIRESLLSRASQCPRLWCRAEQATSDAGIDGFLCALGRKVSDALQSLSDSAESSRVQLREIRAVVHAAVNARFEEVEQAINAAEAVKSTALERELVSVDATLERWRGMHTSFNNDVAALSNTELIAQHATLSSRLDDMEVELRLLPTAVVEPPFVGLTTSVSYVLAAIAGCVRVIAPLSITAADVTLSVVPETTHVWPGDTAHLRLALGARHAPRSDEDYHKEGDGGAGPAFYRTEHGRDTIVAAYLRANLWPEARNARAAYTHFKANADNSSRVGSKHLFESLRRLLAPSLCNFNPRGTTYSNPRGTRLAHPSYGPRNNAEAAAVTAAKKTSKAKNSTSVAVSSSGCVGCWNSLSRLPLSSCCAGAGGKEGGGSGATC